MTKSDKFLLEHDDWASILPLFSKVIHIEKCHSFKSVILADLRKSHQKVLIEEDNGVKTRYILITRNKTSVASISRDYTLISNLKCNYFKEDKRFKKSKEKSNNRDEIPQDQEVIKKKLKKENSLLDMLDRYTEKITKAASIREEKLLENLKQLEERSVQMMEEMKKMREEAQIRESTLNSILKENGKSIERLEQLQFLAIKQQINLNMNFINQLPSIKRELWANSCNKVLSLKVFQPIMTTLLTNFSAVGGNYKIAHQLIHEGILNSYGSMTLLPNASNPNLVKGGDSNNSIISVIGDNNSNHKHLSENDLELFCQLSSCLLADSEPYLKPLEDGSIEIYHNENIVHTFKAHSIIRSEYFGKAVENILQQDFLNLNSLKNKETSLRRWHFFPVLKVNLKNSALNHFSAYVCSLQVDKQIGNVLKCYYFNSLNDYYTETPDYVRELEDCLERYGISIMRRQEKIKLLNPQSDNYTCGYYVLVYLESLITMKPKLWLDHLENDKPFDLNIPVHDVRHLRQLQLLLLHDMNKNSLSLEPKFHHQSGSISSLTKQKLMLLD